MKRSLWKTYAILVIPLILQNLATSSVNLLDTLMVGQLGETSIAAVGMANRVFFVYNLMMFGLCSGSTIFFAQYWGKKDYAGIQHVMGVGLSVAVTVALLFTAAAQLIPETLMRILVGDNGAVIAVGVRYLHVMSISFLFFGINFMFGAAMKAMEKPKIPLFGSILSLVLNGSLNYILIFGKLGMPRMGILGAATATTIARFGEMLFLIVLSRPYWPILFTRLRAQFSFSRIFLRNYFITSLPVFLNETLWGVGITVYSAVLARMGDGVAAAYNIVGTTEQMLSAVIYGTGSAAAVLIGIEIGARRLEHAQKTAAFLQRVALLQGLAIGALIFLIAPYVVNLFALSEQSREIFVQMLRITGFALPFKSFVLTSLVGIMRGGGDTLVCMLLDVGGVWLIGVPLALLGANVWLLSAPIVLALTYVEELVKGVFAFFRIRSGKWINDLVNEG